jgi:cytochrome c553
MRMRALSPRQVLPVAIPVAILLASASLARAVENTDEEGHKFFENKVRPILVKHCYECHGPETQEAKLRFDSWEAIQRGGEGGAVLVPGEPEGSLLVAAISHKNPELKMPPEKKLSDQEIADLTAWIKRGAPHPERSGNRPAPMPKFDLEQARKFWSFRPVLRQALPIVRDAAWPGSPLDAFVLHELEAKSLRPAKPADKATWLRRASFDLTGLPPTPIELEEYIENDSPDADARVVDRLLASPHYGERWGRHWLDVARYADSNGLDENIAHGNAWRYRDYVISALNRDKPYDQFLLEQLAGDLLPTDDLATKHERLIATGFLSLGPKVLAEVDETKMEMDILDEQIDTLGRAVLGLTFGCARCHDHKFDPILAQDYYALAGIFKSTRTMEHFKKIAKWWENPIATPDQEARKAAHDKQVADAKAAIADIVKRAKEEVVKAAAPGAEPPKNPESQFPVEVQADLKKRREELGALEKTAPEIPTAMGVTEGQVTEVAIHIRGSHLTLGPKAQRGFPAVLVSTATSLPADHSGRLELAQWLVRPDHPLTSRVMANRIWRWHFGQGLVPTTDNFGKLGEPPTHPALLDWLAMQLMERNWSLKEIHRLVMLSSTYRMSSEYEASAAATDPENRLYWRMPVRRLEAEELRDALLATSGLIDKQMGGSLLHVKNREFLFDHTSKDNTKYDSLKRAVYLPVIRNNLYDVFQLFDATDATVLDGNRASTVVAPQALFLMNGELVDKASQGLAKAILEQPEKSTEQRLHALYRRAFARSATETELARAQAFLQKVGGGDSPEAERSAWTSLCHVLFAANEFMYLR